MKPLNQITGSVFAVLLLAATPVHAEQYGLANMLNQAPSIADSIRPASKGASVRDEELETPARRQARHPEVSPRTAEANVAPQIDWHQVVQSALHSGAKPEATSQAPAERKQNPLDEPKLRPLTARDRLLSAVGSKPEMPSTSERMAPTVSDLGAFRARSLASDTTLPGSRNLGEAHNAGIGRGTPTHSGHGTGYTQASE